jgi:hypothetical protein
MTTRAQQMDDFLVRLEKQVWAIWLPVVASAALASTGIRVGYVVCQRTASGIRYTWNGSVTTGAHGSRCTTPGGSAAACKAPLTEVNIARGIEGPFARRTVNHICETGLSRKGFLELFYQSFRFLQFPNHLLVSLHCG